MTHGHPSHRKGARRRPTENQGAQQNPSRADFCEKLEQSLQTETHQEFLFPAPREEGPGEEGGKEGAEPGQLRLVPGAVAGMAVLPPSELQDVYERPHSD